MFQRAEGILRASFGEEHPLMAILISRQAALAMRQGRLVDANRQFLHAIRIGEKILGPRHHTVAWVLTEYAKLLRRVKRKDEAHEVEARGRDILDSYAAANGVGQVVDINTLVR